MEVRGLDGTRFSPSRDLRYAYQSAIKAVGIHFDSRMWEDLMAYAMGEGLSYDDLVDTMDALLRFLNSSVDNAQESMHEVLQRSGWLDQPPAAQIALMAMLGRVVLGQYFDALRSTTETGERPEGLDAVILEMTSALDTSKSPGSIKRFLRWLESFF